MSNAVFSSGRAEDRNIFEADKSSNNYNYISKSKEYDMKKYIIKNQVGLGGIWRGESEKKAILSLLMAWSQ